MDSSGLSIGIINVILPVSSENRRVEYSGHNAARAQQTALFSQIARFVVPIRRPADIRHRAQRLETLACSEIGPGVFDFTSQSLAVY